MGVGGYNRAGLRSLWGKLVGGEDDGSRGYLQQSFLRMKRALRERRKKLPMVFAVIGCVWLYNR